MFLNVLLLVVEKLDHLTATKTTQDYLWYCQEGIYNRILEKVTHYAVLEEHTSKCGCLPIGLIL